MKLISCIIPILICFNVVGNTQHVSAYLKDCDVLDLHKAIDCTGKTMTEYFLNEIDQDLCPEDDSPNTYSVIFNVDTEGNTIVSSVYANPYKQVPCIDYFKERAEEIRNFIEFNPGLRNDESISSRTHFKIKHPAPKDLITPSQKSITSMPIFNACQDLIASELDKSECAKNEYLKFIFSQIRYPKKARKNRIKGTVVVKFIVDINGNINNIELLKDIGYDCGDEALRVMAELAKLDKPFIPGFRDGELADWPMTLPIKFNLPFN